MTLFCTIGPNLCLLIFNIAISHDISTVQRILFFDVSIIFCDFFNTKKSDPRGEGEEVATLSATVLPSQWRTTIGCATNVHGNFFRG